MGKRGGHGKSGLRERGWREEEDGWGVAKGRCPFEPVKWDVHISIYFHLRAASVSSSKVVNMCVFVCKDLESEEPREKTIKPG